MKSNRTTIVFFVIVGLAVCVVLAGVIYRVLPELIVSPGAPPCCGDASAQGRRAHRDPFVQH
jgi:hypothetical protein